MVACIGYLLWMHSMTDYFQSYVSAHSQKQEQIISELSHSCSSKPRGKISQCCSFGVLCKILQAQKNTPEGRRHLVTNLDLWFLKTVCQMVPLILRPEPLQAEIMAWHFLSALTSGLNVFQVPISSINFYNIHNHGRSVKILRKFQFSRQLQQYCALVGRS